MHPAIGDRIGHLGPGWHWGRAVGEWLRGVGDVLGLAVRETAGRQHRTVLCKLRLWSQVPDASDEAIPDALCRLYRDLLPDDGAGKREEGLAAPGKKDLRMRPHDARHHRIAPRQRALGAVPVVRLHNRAIRLHSAAD